MSLVHQIYRCDICKNVVEVVNAGDAAPFCCGQAMELLEPKTQDDNGYLKHLPIIERTDDGIVVKVGEVLHPSDPGHYIQWVELIADGRVYRKFLEIGENPEAVFNLVANDIEARAYCNVHGLWHNIL